MPMDMVFARLLENGKCYRTNNIQFFLYFETLYIFVMLILYICLFFNLVYNKGASLLEKSVSFTIFEHCSFWGDRVLRYLAHMHGATLQFYSSKDAGLVKKVKLKKFVLI